MKKRVVVFISGNGSNMLALFKATRQAEYPAEITSVICDNPHALGIQKANENGLPIHIVDRRKSLNREDYEESILTLLTQDQPHFICLAGYMQILSKHFVQLYKNRILNIHPSLLPLFKGLNTHERVLKEGVKITGCTVHLITEKVDEGKILAQAAVPVHPDDTADTLAQRVLEAEHTLYPEALKRFIIGTGDSINTQQKLFSF